MWAKKKLKGSKIKSEVIIVASRSWLVLNEISSADSFFDHFLEHLEYFSSRIRKRISKYFLRMPLISLVLKCQQKKPIINFWNRNILTLISVRCGYKYCRNFFDLGRYQFRYWCWILQIESFQSKDWYGLPSSLSNISSERRTEIRSCGTYRSRHSL